jgi:hypothetical protein
MKHGLKKLQKGTKEMKGDLNSRGLDEGDVPRFSWRLVTSSPTKNELGIESVGDWDWHIFCQWATVRLISGM